MAGLGPISNNPLTSGYIRIKRGAETAVAVSDQNGVVDITLNPNISAAELTSQLQQLGVTYISEEEIAEIFSQNGNTTVEYNELPALDQCLEEAVLDERWNDVACNLYAELEALGIYDDDLAQAIFSLVDAATWDAFAAYISTNVESAMTLVDALYHNLENEIRIEAGDRPIRLEKVLARKSANCVGSTQVFTVLAKALGLNVRPIEVVHDHCDMPTLHVATLVTLPGGRTQIVDLATRDVGLSKPFAFSGVYQEAGIYSQMAGTGNINGRLHSKIRLLDTAGLLAYVESGSSPTDVLSENSAERLVRGRHAVELDPNNVWAHLELGSQYVSLAETNQRSGNAALTRESFRLAEGCYFKALDLIPGFFQTEVALAHLYSACGDSQQSIVHYKLAIDNCLDFIPPYQRDYKKGSPITEEQETLVNLYIGRSIEYKKLEANAMAMRDLASALQVGGVEWYRYHGGCNVYPGSISRAEVTNIFEDGEDFIWDRLVAKGYISEEKRGEAILQPKFGRVLTKDDLTGIDWPRSDPKLEALFVLMNRAYLPNG